VFADNLVAQGMVPPPEHLTTSCLSGFHNGKKCATSTPYITATVTTMKTVRKD